jgi:hypothetical protein
MRYFHWKILKHGLWLCLACIAGCGSPGYNDNPSQKITPDRVGCLAAAEFFSVYFSTRLKPLDGSIPDTPLPNAEFRRYCGNLPGPGKVFFSADLNDPEIRKAPIAIRVVEQEPADSTEGFKTLRTLLDLPAQRFDKGLIESSFDIYQKGQYAVYLIRKEPDGKGEVDRLMIPLNVGVYTGNRFLENPMAPQIIVLIGLGVVGCILVFKAYQFNPLKKP